MLSSSVMTLPGERETERPPRLQTPQPKKPSTSDLVGQTLSDRYEIKKLLGAGGMGAVYLAEHVLMHKRVAIKVLHADMSRNAEILARFEREAVAAAHIDHPHVAHATDFGRTEDGSFFLVLEYLEGPTLRDVIREGPLAPVRALHITRQIALALGRAHDMGIIHRDMKPENVMLVSRDGDPDFVKILDFGIAKVSVEAVSKNGAEAGAVLTRLGTIFGTPEYMAPEQAVGDAVGPAADLYAVGIMLYEMLTGYLPFEADDPQAYLSLHVLTAVPPMSERAPGVTVPGPVEAMVRRLLEKQVPQRLATGAELASAIDALRELPRALVAPGASSSARWSASDAVARTNYSPGPRVVAMEGGRALLSLVRRVPSNTRIVIGASLAVVLVVLVVASIVVGTRAPRATLGDGGVPMASPSTRSPDDDPLVQRAKVQTLHASGDDTEAMKVLARVLELDPTAAGDSSLSELARSVAQGPAPASDAAFALLEGPFGEDGFDLLLEMSQASSPSPARTRAAASVQKPEVRAHASSAAKVVLDLRAAKSCQAKRDVLPSAKEAGDARVLGSLRGLRVRRGCGFLSLGDCYPCLHRDRALEDAISAIEARQKAR